MRRGFVVATEDARSEQERMTWPLWGFTVSVPGQANYEKV